MTVLAAAIELIVLHMVDGRPVQVNPQQVTHLINPSESGYNTLLVAGAKCVVRLTDGNYVSVVETCEEVQRVIEGKTP